MKLIGKIVHAHGSSGGGRSRLRLRTAWRRGDGLINSDFVFYNDIIKLCEFLILVK